MKLLSATTNLAQATFGKLGFELKRTKLPLGYASNIPDREHYRPLFQPWHADATFRQYFDRAAPRTLVSPDRCYVLYSLLKQAIHLNGDIWECGVYRGGTAAMMAKVLADKCPSKRLYLFDTFKGMPETDSKQDLHKEGDFADTSVQAVANFVGHRELCSIREGFIPDTFVGLESARIALAHIDVDIYKSILDCLAFIWPKLTVGGFIVFDDYAFASCPGARAAVDSFFTNKASVPLCLHTGQAIVFKSIV